MRRVAFGNRTDGGYINIRLERHATGKSPVLALMAASPCFFRPCQAPRPLLWLPC